MHSLVGVLFLEAARPPFVFCFLLMGNPPFFSFFFSFCWLAKKVILKIESAEIKFF
jgi:hypothetical protein